MSTFFPHLLSEAYSQVYQQEEFDPTDMVLDYLMDEGYADNEDEAIDILEQLEGDVIQGIINEKLNGMKGKIDPCTGKYEKDGSASGLFYTPIERTEMVADNRKKHAKTARQQEQADKMKRIAQNMKEEFDTYDLVLDYLLDEGYADTEESALKIMSNMSEEWVEEALTGSRFERLRSRLKKDPHNPALKNLTGSEEGVRDPVATDKGFDFKGPLKRGGAGAKKAPKTIGYTMELDRPRFGFGSITQSISKSIRRHNKKTRGV